MCTIFMYYTLLALFGLALMFSRSWQVSVLLSLVELVWICICALWGFLFIDCGDLFFLYWACVLLFFSAIELVLSAVLFISLNSNFQLSGFKFKR